MVSPSPEQRLEDLDAVLSALAHRARRQILMTLWFRGGSMLGGDIARRFSHAWPTTTRHLRVLEEANLVTCEPRGRNRIYRVNLDKLRVTTEWLGWFEAGFGADNADRSGPARDDTIHKDETMAKTPTALVKMREICRALPDTKEITHFGQPAFAVGGKMFTTCSDKGEGWQVVVQLAPDHVTKLVARHARFKRYPRAQNCVSIDAAQVTDWNEVRELVLESYNSVVPTKRPAKRVPARSRKKT